MIEATFPERSFSKDDSALRTITSHEVSYLLPHGSSKAHIDKAHINGAGNLITAICHLDSHDPVFDDHFPGNPILMGVLHVEIAAQAAILLVRKKHPEIKSLPYLTKINGAEFKRPALPGDTLSVEVELSCYDKNNPKAHPFEFSFRIRNQNGKLVSSGRFEGVAARS